MVAAVLVAPTAPDRDLATGLPLCPDTVAGSRPQDAPAAAPSRSDPTACRAQATRVEPAAAGALPIPEPGYHHLGGTTREDWSGVLGRLGVRDTGVRADSFDFVATRFLAKRGTDSGGTTWLEVGWADTGWSADGGPRVYTFDSAAMSWEFYDQYDLRAGDRVWFYLHSAGAAWQAWLWWDNRWQLLDAPELPLGPQARLEQYVEVHVDSDHGGDSYPVPRVAVDGVHLQREPGDTLRRWHQDVATVIPPGSKDYCLDWEQAFYNWSAGDCHS